MSAEVQGAPVVIGGGPAGLAAAHELTLAGHRPKLFEMTPNVGGLSRTESYKGFLFDVGGHRFYTRSEEVQRLWEALLGEDFIRVQRLSRIYYAGRFFQYPLRPLDTLRQLGLYESGRVVASYLRTRLQPAGTPRSFEEWTVRRFGRRLYEIFFKSYTEKVWGIPCHRIAADWADLRIGNLSLSKAVRNALFRRGGAKSLIEEFQYPRRGPGMLWSRLQRAIETGGGAVHLGAEVIGLHRSARCVERLTVRHGGVDREIACGPVISTMPLADLMLRLRPAPPAEVLAAARGLRYRAFIMVGLILRRPRLFPDNWIYIHSPAVQVGRVQNFSNWSAELVPDPGMTSVGMEYFCDVGDRLWGSSDAELIALARRELAALDLASPDDVVDGTVVRETAAYPLYSNGYREKVETIRNYVDTFTNLQTVGRNGMHRYNNQDHSMLAGLLAARNLVGGAHDLWAVNPDALTSEENSMSAAAARR
jgi:protoporphyrinogen oxidase